MKKIQRLIKDIFDAVERDNKAVCANIENPHIFGSVLPVAFALAHAAIVENEFHIVISFRVAG